MALIGPDWTKLYAKGQCLYFGVPFTDKQWAELEAAKNQTAKDKLIREWRAEYMKNVDLLNGNLLKTAELPEEKAETPKADAKEEKVEESIEDVETTKTSKKGK